LKKINEWNGDNRAYGKNFGGGFVGGGDLSKYAGQIDTYPFKASKLTGADTLTSQRTGLVSSSYKGDYYEDEEMSSDEELDIEELMEVFVNKYITKSTIKLINEQDDGTYANDLAYAARGYKGLKYAQAYKEFGKDPQMIAKAQDMVTRGLASSEKEAMKALKGAQLGGIKSAGHKTTKAIAKEMVSQGIHATEQEALAALKTTAGEGIRKVGTAEASFLSRLPFMARYAGMAIPVLDIGIAITFMISSLKQINNFNKEFNKILNLEIGSELPNFLIDANDREFEKLIEYINDLFSRPSYSAKQKKLKNQFNDILLVFKDLFMTLLVAINPYVTGGLASVVPVLGTALGYLAGKGAGITGAIAIHMIPAERILFELSSEVASGIEAALKIFESDEKYKEGKNDVQRGSLAYCFLANFTQSLDRMGQIYRAIYVGEKSVISKVVDNSKHAAKAISLMEEKEKELQEIIDDLNEYEDYASKINAMDRKLSNQRIKHTNDLSQDVNEFSGVGAIGGGPVTPLGTNAYGKRETPRERKRRQKFNRTKSFPYK
jgi:hypothetical protein